MAFVSSQNRWATPKPDLTPGPGSHSPDLIQNLTKSVSTAYSKIKKGTAFGKAK